MHDNSIDNNPSNDALSKSEKAREIKHQYQKNRNKKRYAAKFREAYKKKHGKLPQGIKEKLLYRLKENVFVKKYVLIGGGVTAIMAIITPFGQHRATISPMPKEIIASPISRPLPRLARHLIIKHRLSTFLLHTMAVSVFLLQ